jgi:UDP-3-O-[3-hydroxymyristoyl] glucosamine N-acyltransferase
VTLALADIVAALGGELHGDGALAITRLAPLDTAGATELGFLSNPKYRQQLAASHAGCVVVGPSMRDEALARGACIVAEDPYLYFARLTRLWKARHAAAPPAGVHPTAVVEEGASVHPSASVGPHCVVESGATIGAGTVLKARVHVGHGCSIGERCILHPGAVIGADGFGFAPHAGTWEKIEQLGAVRIGNDVEVGANTCVDRGALDDTVLEDGVKVDNLVQIAHNCRIGRHTAIAGCAGLAGSTVIGAYCTIGGAAMLVGHVKLADHVHISAGTLVSRDITQPGQYTGVFPIDDNASWEKNAATLRQLYRLRERIRALEKQDKP